MPDPIDPPRPSLRSGVRDFLAGCTWNQKTAQVEDASGNPIHAWLNQTGVAGMTAAVQWDAGTAAQAGGAVRAVISEATLRVIQGGSYDPASGLVEYAGKKYRFSFESSGGAPAMIAWSV